MKSRRRRTRRTQRPRTRATRQGAALESARRNARDWQTAQDLQETVIAWDRQQAAGLLALPPESLTESQRNIVHNLAVDLQDLGNLLREQGHRECVAHYLESMELNRRIGDRRGEGIAAFNLGNAYENIPALRDLDQAEHWYRRRLELLETHDVLGRARATGQLGSVAYERFLDARQAGESVEQQAGHLTSAATAYQQTLDIFPPDAVRELAVTHHQLGIIYANAGDTDTALSHYQKSIQYEERQDNRYGAGNSRYAAALALTRAGRYQEALLYGQAALRDYQAVGPGASANAETVGKLITRLEQELG